MLYIFLPIQKQTESEWLNAINKAIIAWINVPHVSKDLQRYLIGIFVGNNYRAKSLKFQKCPASNPTKVVRIRWLTLLQNLKKLRVLNQEPASKTHLRCAKKSQPIWLNPYVAVFFFNGQTIIFDSYDGDL